MTLRINQDDSRKKDEAQVQQLQQQIDELRRLIREQTGRQNWGEEQHKQLEARIANFQTLHDQQLQDVTLALRARQADEQRTKKAVAELEQRIDEPLKPIRDLKAQIAELSDQRKKERDDTAVDKRMIEDLSRQIRDFVAQISLSQDQYHQVTDKVRDLEIQIGHSERETLRVGELQRVEEQRARRDAVEVVQRIEEIKGSYAQAAAKVQRLEELHKQDVILIEEISSRLGTFTEVDLQTNEWVARVEQNAQEKLQILRERIEEVRYEIEQQIGDLKTNHHQQNDRMHNRIQELDEWCRDLESKLLNVLPKLDELYHAYDLQADEIQRLEEEGLKVQIENFQRRYDEVRQRRLTLNATPPEPLRPRMIHNDPDEGGFVER